MREGEGLRGATFQAWTAIEVDHPRKLVLCGIIVGGRDDGRLVLPDAASEDFKGVGG